MPAHADGVAHAAGDPSRPAVPGRPSGAVDRSAVDVARLRARLAAVEPTAASDPGAVVVVRAPGRVNLIGEHTDYNDGLVLPAAIDLEIRIALVPTRDRRVEIVLDATGERAGFDLDAVIAAGPVRRGGFADYVAGTAWAMHDAGLPLRGFRGILASTLPQGSGLSSSAALELASAWALSPATDPAVDPLTLARICQRAENAYVGVACGLMDQFASSCGRADGAVLLDCRSLEHRAVPLPLVDHALVVCHTGSERKLQASEYNARRAQCERAVAVLAERGLPVRALRDVTPAMLDGLRGVLDDETFRRCAHVVGEDARVLATIDALGHGDLPAVGRLFAESHASLRDLYEVSSPELDALVAIADGVPGVVAARMTGAGFGGCTVNLVRRDAVDALARAVHAEYPARTGLTPRVLAVDPAAGAGIA
jgi:galactokinase